MSADVSNPFAIFEEWFAAAKKAEADLPEAMSVATASKDGKVTSRMVLLKSFDASGFVFFTNTGSRKAADIAENSQVALLFHWKSQSRQVRITGAAQFVDDAEADAYFATRPRGAQIGAWASRQSGAMEGLFSLEKEVAKFTAKFGAGKIPRPPFWTGYRIVPDGFEFWEEGRFRLHRRRSFTPTSDGWSTEWLYP